MATYDDHTFKHHWSKVTLASWLRYPNQANPEIASIDILAKDFDPDQDVLTIRRLITLKPTSFPDIIRSILGVDSPTLYLVEDTVVELNEQKMTRRTKNFTFSSFLQMEEECHYDMNQSNPHWTDFHKNATCTSAWPYQFLRGWMESFFKNNNSKGFTLMEQTIDRLQGDFGDVMDKVETSLLNKVKQFSLEVEVFAQDSIANYRKIEEIIAAEKSAQLKNIETLTNESISRLEEITSGRPRTPQQIMDKLLASMNDN